MKDGKSSIYLICVMLGSLILVNSENPCPEVTTSCKECILKSSTCAWCSGLGFGSSEKPRCDTYSNLISSGCPIDDLNNPTIQYTAIEDDGLRDADSTSEQPVQVQPQKVELSIRPGKSYEIDFQVRPSVDYPVDMYFVMDLSRSMRDDLVTMKSVIGDLAREMATVTTDLRLGFASFVDKTVVPYVISYALELDNPCFKEAYTCEKPYGFRNVIGLSDDIELFENTLQAQTFSMSLDRPEGGLDALMQATVCKEAVGWRNYSRHFIIYMSDAGFHFALDGKLGGLTLPNDGECHLNEQGYYTHSVTLDYPSLGQLHEKLLERNVIPIFAVTKTPQRDDPTLYQQVVDEFFQGAAVGTLDDDSKNIITLVRSSYDKITSEIQLVDTVTAPVRVTYSAYCDGFTETPNSQNCSNVVLGNVIKFKLDISVDECTENPITFSVKPIGFEEQLEVVIITNCDCQCSKSVTPNSELCTNGNGSLACGICECNEGRYGEVCECDDTNTDETTTSTDSQPCQQSNSSLVCSGQGSCICGKCVCNKRQDPLELITGRFCNCDNFSCRRDSADLICGGSAKGTCVCGECECKPGYSGPDCSCLTSTANCLASNGLECNNAGNCVCGACMCNATLVYDGPTCEDCDTCPAKCDRNRDCVQCLVYGTGVLSEEECNKCPQRIILVDEEELIVNETDPCTYKDELGCLFSFNFLMNGTEEIIIAQRITSCPEGIDALWLAIGIIIGILLVGLALLLAWKIATYIYDKREYAKFLKELENARSDANINPLFKSSTTSYKNPTYGR